MESELSSSSGCDLCVACFASCSGTATCCSDQLSELSKSCLVSCSDRSSAGSNSGSSPNRVHSFKHSNNCAGKDLQKQSIVIVHFTSPTFLMLGQRFRTHRPDLPKHRIFWLCREIQQLYTIIIIIIITTLYPN